MESVHRNSPEPDPYAAIPSYLYRTMSGEHYPAISNNRKVSLESSTSAFSLSPPGPSFLEPSQYMENYMSSRCSEYFRPSGSPGPFGSSGTTGSTRSQGAFGSLGSLGPSGSPGPFASPGPVGSIGSPGAFGSSGSLRRSVSPGTSGTLRPSEPFTSQFRQPSVRKTTNLFCGTHSSLKGFFCSTCTITLCPHCATEGHEGHDMNFIREAITLAQIAKNTILADIRTAMEAIQEAIASVQRRSVDIERNSIQAASGFRTLLYSFTPVLKSRERRVLQTIDNNRQTKGRNLSIQKENLRSAFYKLKSIGDELNEPIDHMNPVNFIAANEAAKLKLRKTLARVPELEPCEADDIKFPPPNQSFIFPLANLSLLMRYYQKTPTERRQLAFRQPFLCPNDRRNSGGAMNKAIHGARPLMVVMNPGRRPIAAFGTAGDGDGELCRPWGVCCDRYGNIIVADRSNNRIQVFDNEGHYILKFGGPGSGLGQFNKPAGITINPAGHVVVADKDNHRIQIFTTDGLFVRTFGKYGKENGEFNYPWDVACNVQGQIVVSDTKNRRIQLFSASGVYLNKFSNLEIGDAYLTNQLDSPRGVCFTPEGNILVSDFNYHRLMSINVNMLECRMLGYQGKDSEGFERPQGVVCDDEGQIIVADSKNHRIKVLDKQGNLRYICGQSDQDNYDLDTPSGICINTEGNIVVVDFGNSRIKIY